MSMTSADAGPVGPCKKERTEMKMSFPLKTLATACLAMQPAVALALTFPCTVENVCRIAGPDLACEGYSGGWEGSWNFVWDGEGFSVESPRGTFQGQLLTRPETWPIAVLVTAADSPMPGLFSLYETGAFMGALPAESSAGSAPPEMLSFQGRCGAPE
jgi:hypothetical protein